MGVQKDRPSIDEMRNKLTQFRITDTDADVFIMLAQEGLLSATALAKRIEKPKTSIYHSLETLIERGFVIVHKSDRGRTFEANITHLNYYVLQEKERVETLQEVSNELVVGLSALHQNKKDQSQFKVYHGLDGIKQVQWNVLRAENLIFYYTGADRRKLFGDEWIRRYWDEFVRRDLHEIGFESEGNSPINPDEYFAISPGYLERSGYKFVEGINTMGEVYIYNNVYAFYTWKNSEYVGVEIYNEALVTTQRNIFEKLWGTYS